MAEDEIYQSTLKNIMNIILISKKNMIREEDLKNICDISLDFAKIISDVYLSLKNIGLELITTKFLEHTYYILTSEGKDDNITPSQYGTLALIIALSKEVDEDIQLNDLKEMFQEVWVTDVEFLIENDYLRRIKNNQNEIIKVSPLGKAVLKNIIGDLKLKNLIEYFESDPQKS